MNHDRESPDLESTKLAKRSAPQEKLRYSYGGNKSRFARHCESCGQRFISTQDSLRVCHQCLPKKDSPEENLAPAS